MSQAACKEKLHGLDSKWVSLTPENKIIAQNKISASSSKSIHDYKRNREGYF